MFMIYFTFIVFKFVLTCIMALIIFRFIGYMLLFPFKKYSWEWGHLVVFYI